MGDEEHVVDITYKYGADTSGLSKVEQRKRALIDLLDKEEGEQTELNKAMRDGVNTLNQAGRAIKTRSDAEKKLIKDIRASQKALRAQNEALALKGSVEGIEKAGRLQSAFSGMNGAVGALSAGLGQLDPKLAKSAAALGGLAGAGSAAGQSILQFSSAKTKAEKTVAGFGAAIGVAGIALQAYNLALDKINRDTEEYVNGAAKRYFENATVTETRQRQLNAAIAAGFKGFKEGAPLVDNYTAAIKFLREEGLIGLNTDVGKANVAVSELNASLADIGAISGGKVEEEAEKIQVALDNLQETANLTEEEAFGRLGSEIASMAGRLGKLSEDEIPENANRLVDLAKGYKIVESQVDATSAAMDRQTGALAAQSNAIEDQITKIRDGLNPEYQAMLDAMTSIEGQTDETRLAQAQLAEWTQRTSLAVVEAKLAAGEYVDTIELQAAGITDLTVGSEQMAEVVERASKAIKEEGESAKKAAPLKEALGESERSAADGVEELGKAAEKSGDIFDREGEEDFGRQSEEGGRGQGVGGLSTSELDDRIAELQREGQSIADEQITEVDILSEESFKRFGGGGREAGGPDPGDLEDLLGDPAAPGAPGGRAAEQAASRAARGKRQAATGAFGATLSGTNIGAFGRDDVRVVKGGSITNPNPGPQLSATARPGGGGGDDGGDGVTVTKGTDASSATAESAGLRDAPPGGGGGGPSPTPSALPTTASGSGGASALSANLTASQQQSATLTQSLISAGLTGAGGSVVTETDIGLGGTQERDKATRILLEALAGGLL